MYWYQYDFMLVGTLVVLSLVLLIQRLIANYRTSKSTFPEPQVSGSAAWQAAIDARIANQAGVQAIQYNKPNFKNNDLEEIMISRSFDMDTKSLFEDNDRKRDMDMGMHMAGLPNGSFVEDLNTGI